MNLVNVSTSSSIELRDIEEFVRGVDQNDPSKEVPFSFQQIMPCPTELLPRHDTNGRQMSDDMTNDEKQRLIRLYGHDGWYDWRIANWGTKWDCYEHEHEKGSNTWEFQTAWNSPESILKYLSGKFPTTIFTVRYADEDLGSNCGIYEIKDGKITSQIHGDFCLACEVWGYDYQEELAQRQKDEPIEEDGELKYPEKETYSQPAMCPECGSKQTWSNSSGELQCDNCGYSETE